MAVKMHWMTSWGRVVDDDSNGGVRAEILDVPEGIECQVPFLDL